MRIIGIIPARFASTRFPGKPLAIIDGKPMIQRVYEQAKKSKSLDRIVVATDDDRVADCVKGFGGDVYITSNQHQSGTDRCAEVVKIIDEQYDVAINIQGDEPYIHPDQISLLVRCFEKRDTQIATLIKDIKNAEELLNPSVVKVVLDGDKNALYFSRQPIPFLRNHAKEVWLMHYTFFKHIGIYGYTIETLIRISRLQPSSLEQAESLEQLRWLENGYKIATHLTTYESIAIDTPQDLEQLNKQA